MKNKFLALLLLTVTTSFTAYAGLDPDTLLKGVVEEIFNPMYKLVAAISVVYFLYGVARYVYELRNPEERSTGRQHMFWGMVGLFIIFSVGGIINLFGDMFGSLGFN